MAIWGISDYFDSNKSIERTNAIDLAIENKKNQKVAVLTMGVGFMFMVIGIAAIRRGRKKR